MFLVDATQRNHPRAQEQAGLMGKSCFTLHKAITFYHSSPCHKCSEHSGVEHAPCGGAIGTMFMVFNIAVTSTVLEPLQCQHHPNDMWTIRSYPSVVCWGSSDHSTM
eukprot:719902-Amphidinium_carterae.1